MSGDGARPGERTKTACGLFDLETADRPAEQRVVGFPAHHTSRLYGTVGVRLPGRLAVDAQRQNRSPRPAGARAIAAPIAPGICRPARSGGGNSRPPVVATS